MLIRRLAAMTVTMIALAAAATAREAPDGRPPWGSVVHEVSVRRPAVAITFDDGPHPLHTPRILDVLRDQGVRATFFLIGRNVRRYPELARRIGREGHAIGNHSETHTDLTTISRAAVDEEIALAAQAIRAATGVRTWLLRPPYGALDERLRGPRGLAADRRHLLVMWSVQARDWATTQPQAVAVRTLQRIEPGSVVLLHDGGGDRDHVVTATRWILGRLTRQGYDLVTVPELLDLQR